MVVLSSLILEVEFHLKASGGLVVPSFCCLHILPGPGVDLSFLLQNLWANEVVFNLLVLVCLVGRSVGWLVASLGPRLAK